MNEIIEGLERDLSGIELEIKDYDKEVAEYIKIADAKRDRLRSKASQLTAAIEKLKAPSADERHR